MTYEEVKNAPLNVLVGYLVSFNEGCECPCSCKWESWAAPNNTINQCKKWAAEVEKHCKKGDSWRGKKYDICLQRLAYERVMEVVEKQMPMEYHRTRTIEQVIGGARETVCPSCLGVTVTCENQFPKYCAWCGQALKDGEDE